MKQQNVIMIEANELIAKVQEMLANGFRFVQIGCTRLPNQNELTYAFDKNYQLIYLKLVLPPDGAKLPSVSSVYWSAFLYENEIHDLYGIKFDGMAIDFKGKFYRTAKANAFAFCERAAAPQATASQPQNATITTGS